MSDQLYIPSAYRGQAWLETGGHDVNALDFVVRMIASGDAQAEPVKVIAVHGGGVGSPPTVDVQPLVNQQDGAGNQTPHGVVYGLPCLRQQGANGAIILDPAVGDIGLASYCDRDISTVVATKAVSPPGSWRQRSRSDGVYVCTMLGSTPTVFVQITPSGLNITAPTVAITGNLTVTGEITAGAGTGDSVTLQRHQHGTGSAAAGTSVPTPGT